MQKIYHFIIALLLLSVASLSAQNSPNCVTVSDDDFLTGRAFFNYGSTTNAFNPQRRVNVTVGQPVVGTVFGQQYKGAVGFWSRFLMPPAPPEVRASEGDLEDRVQVDWTPDPLSPAGSSYKIYRNGALLATVDGETFTFIDFNVIAGKFYTYQVSSVNSFGEGSPGSALGFLNPNGVVTGQVKSSNNNPVPGAIVTLSPTIGASAIFGGDDMIFTEYSAAFPTSQFTLSCWVKIDDGNDNSAIFDFGSHIGKNWWLHTLPAADGKGVRFGMANGSGGTTELEYAFPEAAADNWHNVAVSFSGASVLLYVDGELIGTAVTGYEAGQSPLFLGQKTDASGHFTGNIDELRFYNRQLAQTEIQMFMNRTVAPNAAGLVNYWKFDEGVGSKSFDLTSTKQKLYFCGAGWSSDKPNVVNAGLTDETGFYEIPGINYGAGTTFVATPSKKFYFNQSLEFNSVNNQYVELTDFDLADSSTVEVTVKAFDFSGNQCILTKQNGGTTHFGLHLNAGHIILEMGGNQHDFGTIGMGFHRLSLVIDQPAGSGDAAVTLYDSGDLVGSHTFTGVASDFSGGSVWTLGAGRSGGSLINHFSGLIDDVVFYSTMVSLPDLQLAAAVGTDLKRGDLMNYFPLNEGSGDKVKDYGFSLTGSGTIYGATYSTVAAILNEEPHLFTPSSRLVTLNPSNTSVDQVDFTDQSTVPVSGYVRFENTDCFQAGVEILVNGKRASPPVFTDSEGYFSIEFEPGASAQLTPVFKTHTYYPAFWEIDNIASPVAGVLFRNQVKRHIQGQMAGNAICRKSVIPEGAIVKVKVETLDGCYYKEQQLTESSGKFKFDKLPPLPFTVAVTEHSNNVIYNYFQLQGGKEVDLTDVSDTTDFIYYSPPEIEITVLDTNACGQQMLMQGGSYSTEIKVYQPYDGGRCYLDTAMLTIDNQIADMASFDTLMTTGKLKHKFKASFPNIASPYTKTLTIAAEANTIQNSISTTAVVLGQRPRAVNFTSTSPSIPLMILRDPPGDGSSATISKGTTVCNGWGVGTTLATKLSTGIKLSLGTETVVSAGVGAEVETKTELKNELEMGMSVTTKGNFNTSAEVCLTANETISTSGDGVLQGEDADVFVGGALNLLFGITDDLRFDTPTCEYKIKPDLVVFPDKFASTFLYSGYQIKKVVIPNLEFIGDTVSADQWRDILQRNRDLKAAAVFERNLTFDAGVSYENSSTIENTRSMSYGFGVDISANIGADLGFFFNGTGASFKMGMQIDMGVSTEFSNSQSNSQTVGYTLADDDVKDVFTLDVLQDRVYGTPVFKTISGNSSCPYEEKTVPRDGLNLTVDRTIATNVLENDVAVFKFNLGNISETDEWRYYSLALYNASNPDGAVVKVQGENKSSGNFLVAPGQSQEVIVTVARGPNAYDYENLSFYAISDCEGARYDALGNGDWPPYPFWKEILLDVHFLEPCSPIDIGFPLQNWVMTPADGNIVFITLNEFNRNDADLELIRVQYRRKNGDGAWINITEVPKAQLDNDVFKIVQWNTTGYQDGEYEIRAVTQCFGGQNAGVSTVITGRIERTAPEILGTPEPADGVLSAGDEISIQFTEPIRCDQIIQADFFNNNNIGLYNAETDELIDAVVTCSGDKIVIVPNVPNRFIENRVLRVEVDNIKDLADNVFVHKSWEFFVDRNPMRWSGGNVKVGKYQQDITTVTRQLVNTGGQALSYELSDVPGWVRVGPANGIIAPGAAQDITFVFDNSLSFGTYTDTIFAITPLGNEPLPLYCRVMCPAPDWEFDPTAYSGSMNFTLKLDIEGTLSTDEEDILAAFIDGELRGLAKLQLLPTLPPVGTQYRVFLTVFGDPEDDGKPISLDIWDASSCLRYVDLIESFDFEIDNVIGTVGNPTVLHTNNLIRRDIALNTGWNWISFNLVFPDPSLDEALVSLDHPDNDLIKGQGAFSEYFGGNWLGSLPEVDYEHLFQYRADQKDTIRMSGAPVDPSGVNIPISAGWNWIGFVPNYPLPVSTALSSLTPLNGDIIKGQTAFAQYVAGFGWLGSLQYMEPPKGYQLKISIPGTLTYPPPVNAAPVLNERGPELPNFWTVDPTQYEYSMTLVGMLAHGGINTTLAGHEIGVFAGNELRGSAKAIYLEQLDMNLFFLTMYANTAGELLHFKLYDAATGQVTNLTETMYFTAGLHQGSVQSPIPFGYQSTTAAVEPVSGQSLQVSPNPFTDGTTIRFTLTHAQRARVLITDMAGRIVLDERMSGSAGTNALLWNAKDAPSGVYFVKLETEEGTGVKKVVRN